jgi:hypothetical protein
VVIDKNLKIFAMDNAKKMAKNSPSLAYFAWKI